VYDYIFYIKISYLWWRKSQKNLNENGHPRTESYSWSEKQPGIMVLLTSLTNKSFYENQAKNWFTYLNGGGDASLTPGSELKIVG